MKAHELRKRSTEDLENELDSLKENLFNQKSRSILGQLEDTTLLEKNPQRHCTCKNCVTGSRIRNPRIVLGYEVTQQCRHSIRDRNAECL